MHMVSWHPDTTVRSTLAAAAAVHTAQKSTFKSLISYRTRSHGIAGVEADDQSTTTDNNRQQCTVVLLSFAGCICDHAASMDPSSQSGSGTRSTRYSRINVKISCWRKTRSTQIPVYEVYALRLANTPVTIVSCRKPKPKSKPKPQT